MLQALEEYYRSLRILSTAFECPHLNTCRGDEPRFVEARSACVGAEYGKDSECPKLLFLSLDAGDLGGVPETRTPAGVQQGEVEFRKGGHKEVKGPRKGRPMHKKKHWYRTHELASVILGPWIPDLEPLDSCLHFAHANAVKCCVNKPHNAQAPRRMYEQCWVYLSGEIDVLDPDIIVTQGNDAFGALQKAIGTRLEPARETSEGCRVYEIRGEDRRLVLRTWHPADRRGKFAAERRECWPRFVERARAFWEAKRA